MRERDLRRELAYVVGVKGNRKEGLAVGWDRIDDGAGVEIKVPGVCSGENRDGDDDVGAGLVKEDDVDGSGRAGVDVLITEVAVSSGRRLLVADKGTTKRKFMDLERRRRINLPGYRNQDIRQSGRGMDDIPCNGPQWR